MISVENKKEIKSNFGLHENDTGSSQVQVAILTKRINNLTEHLKQNKKDHATRRGLMKMVGRRNRLLRSLSQNDFASYKDLISRLSLRH